MDDQQSQWDIWRIALAVLGITLVPQALAILIGTTYAFVVGFQTRGDQAAITASGEALANSVPFIGGFLLVVAAVTFWRCSILARMSETNVIGQVAAAVGASIVVRLIMAIISDSLGTMFLLILTEWVLIIAAAALAVYLESKKKVAEAAT